MNLKKYAEGAGSNYMKSLGRLGKYALATAAAAALATTAVSLNTIRNLPEETVLILDFKKCPQLYGRYQDIFNIWLTGEGYKLAPRTRAGGDKLIRRLNLKYNPGFDPKYPTATGTLLLFDENGNGRFDPLLEGCGTIVPIFDPAETLEENVKKGTRPAAPLKF